MTINIQEGQTLLAVAALNESDFLPQYHWSQWALNNAEELMRELIQAQDVLIETYNVMDTGGTLSDDAYEYISTIK